jgi:hypothetical protein
VGFELVGVEDFVVLSKDSDFPPPCALLASNSPASFLRSDPNENPNCRAGEEAGGLVADVLKIGDWDVNSCEGARALGFMCGSTGFLNSFSGDGGAGRTEDASGGWANHASEGGDGLRISMCSFCFPLPSDLGALSDAPQREAPCVFPPKIAFESPAPHASPPFSFPLVLFSSSGPEKDPHPALVPDPQVGAVVPHPSPDELAPQVAAPEPL